MLDKVEIDVLLINLHNEVDRLDREIVELERKAREERAVAIRFASRPADRHRLVARRGWNRHRVPVG